MITALCIISASEIAKVKPDFTYKWTEDNPHAFQDMLYSLGIDITQPIEHQEFILHRNRFNEIVQCDRYVGWERVDYEWINSGYASQFAKDKACNSRLLEDLYRQKGILE